PPAEPGQPVDDWWCFAAPDRGMRCLPVRSATTPRLHRGFPCAGHPRPHGAENRLCGSLAGAKAGRPRSLTKRAIVVSRQLNYRETCNYRFAWPAFRHCLTSGVENHSSAVQVQGETPHWIYPSHIMKADRVLRPVASLYPTREKKTWRTRTRATLETIAKRTQKRARKAATTAVATLQMTVRSE